MSALDPAAKPNPAWRNDFLELLYAALFQPKTLYEAIARDLEASPVSNRLLLFSILSVVVISALSPVLQTINAGGEPHGLMWTVPLFAFNGLLTWAFVGVVIGLSAYAFLGRARIVTLLVLSAMATLPWLLMAPISLLKVGIGSIGVVFSVIFGFIIWLWTVVLFALAIKVTYQMTVDRVLIVLILPFVMSAILLGWVIGFFVNIFQLSPLK